MNERGVGNLLSKRPDEAVPPGHIRYRGETRPVRHVLAVHTQRIGDVINWTPFLAALRRHLPKARITALVQPPGDELLRSSPDVDQVLVYQRREARSPVGLGRLVRQIRGTAADWAVCIHAAEWLSVALALARVPMRTCVWRYGPERPPAWHQLYGERVIQQRAQPGGHEVEHNLAVLRAAGIPAEAGPLRLSLTPADEDEANVALAARGVAGDALLIALHPGHAGGRQNWPAAHYAALGRRLAEVFGARVLVTGSPGEARLAAEVARGVGPAAIDLAGAVSLRGLAALLRRCRLLVSVPTGPMHLAAAVGVPVVALYGPQGLMVDVTRFHPWGVPYEAVRSPQPCACADYRRCQNPVCMRAIAPERVFAAAQRLLAGDG